jgi:hypothetical protein
LEHVSLTDVTCPFIYENISCDEIHAFPSTYAQVAKKDVNQDLFITAEKSIITYGEIFEAHSNVCRGKLKTTKRTMKGHVTSIRLACSTGYF